MKNNLTDLTLEMVELIKSLNGFKSPLTESIIVDELAIKLEEALEKGNNIDTKDAMVNMFRLGQIYCNNQHSVSKAKEEKEMCNELPTNYSGSTEENIIEEVIEETTIPSVPKEERTQLDEGLESLKIPSNLKVEKTLVFSVGIQGSGKSRYFKDKSPVIETDAIRKEMFANVNNLSNERAVFNHALERIVKALLVNDTVYLDATMVETKHRDKFLADLKERVPNIQLVGIVFPTNPEVAKQRIQGDLARGVNRADSAKFVDEYYKYYQETVQLIQDGKVDFKAYMVGDDTKI